MVVCLGQNAFAGTPTPKDLKTDQNSHKKNKKQRITQQIRGASAS